MRRRERERERERDVPITYRLPAPQVDEQGHVARARRDAAAALARPHHTCCAQRPGDGPGVRIMYLCMCV